MTESLKSRRHVLMLITLFSSISKATSQTSGSSLTADGCFVVRENLEITCGYPAQRRLPLDESACQALCLKHIVKCRVAQYDRIIRQCDLFSLPMPTRRTDPAPNTNNSIVTSGWAGVQPVRRGEGFFDKRFGFGSRVCGLMGPEVRVADEYKLFVPTGNPGCATPPPLITSTTSTTPAPVETTEDYLEYEETTTPFDELGSTEEYIYPDEVLCPEGKVAKYSRIEDTELQGNDQIILDGIDEATCLDHCSRNVDLENQPVWCRSAEHSEKEGVCRLTYETFAPTGNGEPSLWEGGNYYEKLCIDEEDARKCPGTFRVVPQMYLLGVATDVVDAKNLTHCVQQCLNANETFGFKCKSGLIFYEDAILNCVLNIGSASEFPTAFAEHKEYDVDYFEVDCNLPQDNRLIADTPRTNQRVIRERTRDLLAIQLRGAWGPWGSCDPAKKLRTRFRNCPFISRNPNNCEVQQEKC